MFLLGPSSRHVVELALGMKFSSLCALFALSLPATSQTVWTDLGGGLAGSAGLPVLVGSGEPTPGGVVQLDLSNAAVSAPAFLVAGLTQVDLPLLGGTLLPDPMFVLPPVSTDAAGMHQLVLPWPLSAPVGVDMYYQYWVVDGSAVQGASASNGLKSAPGTGPEPGTFPATWINGTDCANEPNFQVHAYNSDFYILRQSLCTDYEAPFLYLIFGEERALLIDSGAVGQIGLLPTVNNLISTWATAHSKPNYKLTVAHSHSHGDHTAGDSLFHGVPNTTVVGVKVSDVQSFFGFTNWPTEIRTYDLGNRVIDLIPIPGHQSAHLAYYDRRTANLITGDTLYAGRSYIFGAVSLGAWPVYQASLQRLVDFVATRDLAWVLGTHIEMTAVPGVDYGFMAASHPNEHILQLERKHLEELNTAAQAMGATPVIEIHPDFIIYPIQ